MRLWQAILTISAAAGLTAPAAAQSDVYVPIARTDNVIVLIQMAGEVPRGRKTTHVSQFAYYFAPGFSFEGVPIRLTETEFEIDCENGTSRRVRASAYRDIGDRVGSESYGDPWGPIPAGMGDMLRLACEGIGRDDPIYGTLSSAVGAYGRLMGDASAG